MHSDFRMKRTLERLAGHDISNWALAGGLAIERHIQSRDQPSCMRPAQDIDFVVTSFADIPCSLGTEYLPRHVHPDAPPGKILLQFVDAETAVRIDVFRARGREIDRAEAGMVSLHDCVAHAARIAWDLRDGIAVAPKTARDFLRPLTLVKADALESVWREHRKAAHPKTFAEVADRLPTIIASRGDLLKPPMYSTDTEETCERCRATATLPLADPARVLAPLGYC